MGCVRSKDRGDEPPKKISERSYRPIHEESCQNKDTSKNTGKYQQLMSNNDDHLEETSGIGAEGSKNDANVKSEGGYQPLLSENDEHGVDIILNAVESAQDDDNGKQEDQQQISHDDQQGHVEELSSSNPVESGKTEVNDNILVENRPLISLENQVEVPAQDTDQSNDSQTKGRNESETQPAISGKHVQVNELSQNHVEHVEGGDKENINESEDVPRISLCKKNVQEPLQKHVESGHTEDNGVDEIVDQPKSPQNNNHAGKHVEELQHKPVENGHMKVYSNLNENEDQSPSPQGQSDGHVEELSHIPVEKDRNKCNGKKVAEKPPSSSHTTNSDPDVEEIKTRIGRDHNEDNGECKAEDQQLISHTTNSNSVEDTSARVDSDHSITKDNSKREVEDQPLISHTTNNDSVEEISTPVESDPNVCNGKRIVENQPLISQTTNSDSVEEISTLVESDSNESNGKRIAESQSLISQTTNSDSVEEISIPVESDPYESNGKRIVENQPLISQTTNSDSVEEISILVESDPNECNGKRIAESQPLISQTTISDSVEEISIPVESDPNESNGKRIVENQPLILQTTNSDSVEDISTLVESDHNKDNGECDAEDQPMLSPNKQHFVDKEFSFEKAKTVMNTSVQYLKDFNDYSSDEAWLSINKLTVSSCIISSISNEDKSLLANYLVQAGFAQLFVKIMQSFQANNTSSTGPHMEDSLKIIKGACTNFSTGHEFEVLVCELTRQGAIDLLLKELDESFPATTDNELMRVVHTLHILSNCVRCPEPFVRSTYRKANAVPVLMKYLKSNEIKLKMESLSILAYIVNDEEGDILASTDNCIIHLVDMLKQAVTAEDYYVHYTVAGEPCGDGVYGLIDTMNRLAVNDSSKREIMQHESIPTIVQILQIEGDEATDSQLAALETLWKITFIDNYRQVLIQHVRDTFVFKILTNMQTSPEPALRDASTGLLWKLGLIDIKSDVTVNRLQSENKPSDDPEDDDQERIWLSYNKGNLEQVLKVRERLLAAGFEVWLDEDKADGNLFAPMVEAVANSAVILLCGSMKYKESVYCQTEATYANQLQKPIIPVLVEENYKADGWLAALDTKSIQFQAFSDDVIAQEIDGLIETIWMCIIDQ